ncbi:hypothetical protein DF107_02650 [Burkholderia stagnalis]|uniref:H-NS family nucleoid-associated regulatory protein n=1 Tax=Burkholderia stagnalis TaxID=1503054 RepID=UPI000F5A2FBE|nr:H-NS family nucleoid-associated regulatory protein [Burkholderia stagnalis]RQQ21305.1 hypothetical protein DF161_00610 [Burkholderia stagnalis]RQY84956.1 hypothetical protein DF107_02650 [Burkholderia stagnalis]
METIANERTIEEQHAKDIGAATTIVTTQYQVEAFSQPASMIHQQAATGVVPSEAAVAAASMQAVGGFNLHLSDTLQQFDAQLAQFEAEVARIEQMKEQLRKQRESSIQKEQEIAIPQIMAWIDALDIKPEQLGFAPQPKLSKAPSIPKYRNPETGDMHSGKGSCPGWLTPEAKEDPRYRNPEWTAKKAVDDAAKVAKKNKTNTSDASVAVEPPASNVATAVPNDAPTMTDDVEHPASNDSATTTVANVAVVDTVHVEANTTIAPIVSNLS